MKGVSTWSYAPYRPFFFDGGDIYVCRLAPDETSFHCEWLAAPGPEYALWLRPEAFTVLAADSPTYERLSGDDGLCDDVFSAAGLRGSFHTDDEAQAYIFSPAAEV